MDEVEVELRRGKHKEAGWQGLAPSVLLSPFSCKTPSKTPRNRSHSAAETGLVQ
jgi:hypothetical protein